MSKRKVVVTGAAGRMAGLILDNLRQRYDLTALDIRFTVGVERSQNKSEIPPRLKCSESTVIPKNNKPKPMSKMM